MPALTPKGRLAELDGVRGLAILLIVLVHYVGYSEALSFPSPLVVIKPLLYVAWSGVDLFFVLSGFLITGILLDNRTASNFFQVFYRRRMYRTFPLYCLLLGLFIALASLSWDHRHTWVAIAFDYPMPLGSYFTFTQNFFMAGAGAFGALALSITWSLAIEEQFYLIFPVLIRVITATVLPAVLVLGIVFSAIGRTFVTWAPGYFLLPFRLDGLLCGALLAYVARQPGMIARLRQNKLATFAVFLTLAVGSLGAGDSTDQYSLFGSFRFTWMALVYVALLAIIVIHPDSFVTTIFKVRPLAWLGRVSYGVYLFHALILFLAHGLLLGRAPYVLSAEGAMATAVAAAITLLCAQILHTWVEQPIITLGHKARYAITDPDASGHPPKLGDPVEAR